MFLALGVGAFAAGIFHLMTHAFFKALLFLGAGSVIHAMSGEQDMRNMGGLRKRIPVTFWTMTAGVFAIAGFPPLAGFFSKDEILYRTFISDNPLNKLLWAVGLITALMTSFYMFRLWFKTFFGKERFDEHHLGEEGHGAHGVHESPWTMLLPLALLAILSIAGGWIGIPAALGGSSHFEHFLDPVFHHPVFFGTGETRTAITVMYMGHGLELGLAFVSVLAAAIGLFFAHLYFYRKPGTLGAVAKKSKLLYPTLLNKYWVDEIFSAFVVTPLMLFSQWILFRFVDSGIVDGSGKISGYATKSIATITRRMQSGNIRSYAGWLAAGAAIVILAMTFGVLTAHGFAPQLR